MFTPARKTRGSTQACTRMPRLLSVATTGAVFMGAGFGVMPASADPQPDNQLSVVVDIVGDSYMAGEGLHDTYIDPADPRHQSTGAPALQALARVQTDNPMLRVDASLAAAAGAETADFFHAQAGPDNTFVNAPQRDQIRPDTQLVIVGFGGEDARLARVLAEARRTTGGPNTALDKEIRALGPLLDWAATDEEYLAQATSSPAGQAPTLVARMLQVLAGIAARAPHAKIVVTTYPLAADPDNDHAATMIGEDELTSVRKFGYDLNQAINRAVQICRCGSLIDVSEAIAGHEIYTADPAYNEQRDQQAGQESFHPNDKGASLIANPIADGVAEVLEITAPEPSDGRMTVPKNIDIRVGVSDRDGDRVADHEDRAPDDPARSTDSSNDDTTSSHHGSKPNHSNDKPRGGVLQPIIQVVHDLAPGESPIGQYGQPPTDPTGDNHPGTVESRPPGREQTVPAESTARGLEPATAPPVPGENGSLSQAQMAGVQDVVAKAVPAGYVSQYSAPALRASTQPADVRSAVDKNTVDAQMSRSFVNDSRSFVNDQNFRAGFQARFSENIDAIHNATTVADQDAAIARFNQTAAEYNATELAARDAYGAHPVDAQGETVRVTPSSVADLAAVDAAGETTTYGPVDASTLAAVGEPAQSVTVSDVAGETMTSAQVDASTLAAVAGETTTYGPVDVSTLAAVGEPAQTISVADVAGETMTSGQADVSMAAATGKAPSSSKSAPKSSKPNVNVDSVPVSKDTVTIGPAIQGETSTSAERDGVTITGTAEGKALGFDGTMTGEIGPKGMSGEISGKGVLGEGTVGITAKSANGEAGYEGKGAIGAEAGLSGKYNGLKDFSANANAKVGAEVSVKDSGNYGLVEGSREVTGKAGGEFDAHATAEPGNYSIGSHAFLGAKGTVDAKIGIPGFSIGFKGMGFAGPGYDYGAKYSKGEDGSYKVGVNAGVSPMFGVGGGLDISINPEKLAQSVQDAVNALNPFGPAAQAPADFDAQYSGPTPGTTGENDDPSYSVAAPAEAPADNDAQYSGPTPGTTGENDDPGYSVAAPAEAPADNDAQYSGPTPGTTGENDDPAPAATPASNEPGEAPADNDAQYSGPTPGTTGENDDPSYSTNPVTDSPVNSDDAISSNTDQESDTITGYSGNDTLTGNVGDDTLGGETDAGISDSGYSDSGYSDSGNGDTSDSMGGLGDSSTSGMGDSGMGDSGMGGDSGGMGGDSGGMGGDSGGGMGGDSGGGDSGGGMGGGDSGGGGMGGTGMGSGGMGGGPSGGDGGGF
jgi:lysophospholipase L1-like esterase